LLYNTAYRPYFQWAKSPKKIKNEEVRFC